MALTKVKAGNILLTTPGASSNDVTPATTAYVTTALANLADSAPSTLDTLNELAAALGDDANFSTTVTNSIAAKAPLASPTFTGNADIAGNITVGTNNTILAENNIRFKSSGASYIDHNTVGQAINFRVSGSSSLDTTAMTIDSSGIDVTGYMDADNFKINGAQGSDGQVLTSTGSGIAWEAIPAGGVAGIVTSADATAITIGSDENVTFAQNISSVNNLYVADDIGHAGDSDTYMSFENDYLGFYTGGVNTLVLNNGNVGIGVTAPTGVLAITATDTSNKPQVRFMTTGATNLADAALSTTDDSGGTNLLIGSNQYYSGGSIARFSTDRSGTAIDFGYTGNMKFFTGSGSSAPTERMRVLATGSVSISNDGSVPHSSSKFHVKGTALTMSDSAGNAGGGFQTFSGTKSITGTTAVTIFSLSRTNGAHTGIVMITKSDSGDSAAGIFSFSANYDAAASLSAMNTSVAGYTGFTLSTVVNGNGITFKLAHGNAGTTKNYTYTVLYGGSVNVGTPTLY